MNDKKISNKENTEEITNKKTLEMSSKELDEKLDKQIDKNYDKRVKSYQEALKVLKMEYPDLAQKISDKDIQKMASYQDEEIRDRKEIKELKKIRNKLLSEERKDLEKQLNKELIKNFNSSEVLSTAITKGIMIGLLGPMAIGFIATRQLIDVTQAKKEIRQELLESLDTGEEINIKKTISAFNHKMGSLYNLDGFLENIQRSDQFKEIKDNKIEMDKLLKSINECQKESCDLFCELEEFVEQNEEERLQRIENEEDEDPEPEPGMKVLI